MSRPEVKNAFKRGDGSAVRQSATMGTNTFYYAIKLMMALSSELPGKQVIYGQLEGKFFRL